jgi:Na+/melibiose symporter-like transporter
VLGTALPAGFGYDPAAAVTPPAVQAHLMIFYGLVPALMMAAGTLFLVRFPITRERHAEVRAALDARAGALSDAERFL